MEIAAASTVTSTTATPKLQSLMLYWLVIDLADR